MMLAKGSKMSETEYDLKAIMYLAYVLVVAVWGARDKWLWNPNFRNTIYGPEWPIRNETMLWSNFLAVPQKSWRPGVQSNQGERRHQIRKTPVQY